VSIKWLIVYAHPSSASYCASLLETLRQVGRSNGREPRVRDLYRTGFDPRLSHDELNTYFSSLAESDERWELVEDLRWCEALTFLYPTWWYGMPAVMKGYVDRIFLPNYVLRLKQDHFGIVGLLNNIKSFSVVTTHGSPWWWMTMRMGNPGKRAVMRAIPPLLAPSAKTLWLALYNVDRSSDSARRRFEHKVRASLTRLLECA
jgi:NAD(P)H dehydrogenase (quinone)